MILRQFVVHSSVAIALIVGSYCFADDSRSAWQYEAKNGVRTIVSASHGRWIEYSAVGQTEVLIETERTEKYVELRRAKDDPANAVLFRLFAESGQLRRPEVGQFREFAKGRWLAKDEFDLTSVDKLGVDDHRVRLVYFVPNDRKPIPKYEERIAVVMAYVAEFLQRDLREKGFKTEGLQFEMRDGKPAVRLVRGEQNAAFYNRAPKYDDDEQNRRIVNRAFVLLSVMSYD